MKFLEYIRWKKREHRGYTVFWQKEKEITQEFAYFSGGKHTWQTKSYSKRLPIEGESAKKGI